MSDHGLTLGEDGILGKHGARAQWHIYHVPCMIRHPEGKLAGQTSDYFASTHDVSPTLLSFMGVRRPGLMDGEDLSVLFDGQRPPDRPWFTSCYDNYVLCGRPRLVLHLGQRGPPQAPLRQARATRASSATWPPSTPRSWTGSGSVLADEAGGTLPQFAPVGSRRR